MTANSGPYWRTIPHDAAGLAGATSFRRVALALLVVVGVLTASGVVDQAIATDADVRAFPPPGELVDFGHRQAIRSGGPFLWGPVHPCVRQPLDPDLPSQQQAEMRAFMNGTRVWDSDQAVFQAVDQIMAEVRVSQPLGSMPLVVLTATEHGFPPDTERLHQVLQTELADLSSNSRHQVVLGATHVSLVDNGELAQITADAIRQVVLAARNGDAIQ